MAIPAFAKARRGVEFSIQCFAVLWTPYGESDIIDAVMETRKTKDEGRRTTLNQSGSGQARLPKGPPSRGFRRTGSSVGQGTAGSALTSGLGHPLPPSGVPNPSTVSSGQSNRWREAGLKVTPQRVAVYKALIESKEHPSADMLWRKVRRTYPNISLDTVNRTLLTLAEIGAAFVVEGSGDVKRFDGCLESHQHFRCTECRRIIDFHHKPFSASPRGEATGRGHLPVDNIPIPKSISEKYTVLKKTVYFEGICDLCRKRIGPRRSALVPRGNSSDK